MASPEMWLYRALYWGALPPAVAAMWVNDRLRGKKRPPLRDRLARAFPSIDPDGLWIQAVSVGEVEIARRLVRSIAERRPAPPMLVTSTTATGLALARRTLNDPIRVAACPLDLPGPVQRVLRAVRPRTLVLVETEIWPEMMAQAKAQGVDVAVVNARLSDASLAKYRRVRAFLTPLLEPVSLVLARSEADRDRFADLGVPTSRIEVVGNIKYDLEPDLEPLPWAAELKNAQGGRAVIVAGSTMEGEDEIVLDAISSMPGGFENALLILAPRHPERFDHVAEIVEARGLRLVRRSCVGDIPSSVDVFLLDTIGELSRCFGLGSAAFIGGSLRPTGGHNPLEPAVWGVPVATGPHVFNFREVYDEMIGEGGAVTVDSSASLASVLGEWLNNPESGRRVGLAGLRVVERNRGATERTVEALEQLAVPRSGCSEAAGRR